MSSNPTKLEQKMIAIAKERANGDKALENYLVIFAQENMGATAFMRKLCSFTEDDWDFYQDLREYEYHKNRIDIDKVYVKNGDVNHPRILFNGGTEDEASFLTEEQFERVKRSCGAKKIKISYDTYHKIRCSEYYNADKRCPIGMLNLQE